MITVPVTVRPRTIYLNRLEAVYAKPLASIIINGEHLTAVPLKSGMRHSWMVFPLLLNTLPKAPAEGIGRGWRTRGMQREKKEVKFPPLVDDTTHTHTQLFTFSR